MKQLRIISLMLVQFSTGDTLQDLHIMWKTMRASTSRIHLVSPDSHLRHDLCCCIFQIVHL